MRRKDREVKDYQEIIKIIDACDCCRLGFVDDKEACDYTFLYQCVMGKGRLEIVSGEEEKTHGLSVIMNHYSERKTWSFDSKLIERVNVLKLSVREISSKAHIS